jgi:hypothetical protein
MTYLQLESLRPRLRQFYTESEIDIWMQSEQKLLGWREPIDCDYEEVKRLIAQLEDGVYI